MACSFPAPTLEPATALPATRTLPPAPRPASCRGPAVLHQTGMRDLDFLDGKGSDEISGLQLWQSRPSALSAFALSAVGPCQQNPNLNVTSHPLHLAGCHHRPSFFHPPFFGPPLGLQALFTCFRFRVAARWPWKLPTCSPCVALFRGCSLYLRLFVRRLGRKKIKACSNTPSHFHPGWLMQWPPYKRQSSNPHPLGPVLRR